MNDLLWFLFGTWAGASLMTLFIVWCLFTKRLRLPDGDQ